MRTYQARPIRRANHSDKRMPELIDVLQEELREVLTSEVGDLTVYQIMSNVIAITKPDSDHTVLLHICEGQDLICVFRSTTLNEHAPRSWFDIAHPESFNDMTSAVLANLN